MMNATSCNNLNHRRRDAPVRFCPQCGAVVNRGVGITRCPETVHVDRRRNGDGFCVDCGQQLMK